MRNNKNIFIVLIILLILGSGFLEFPVEKILLTATFGETRYNHFHSGIDLGIAGQKVSPVQKGEVIYIIDDATTPFVQLYGNGNIVVVQHEKKLRSFYYHLKPGTVRKKVLVSETDELARSGNSGRSIGGHLHLTLKKGKKIVNPLAYFSKLKDNTPPVVAAILFKNHGRLITIPKEYSASGFFKFEFLAKAYDQHEKIKKLGVVGIYKIAFYIDGRLAKSYKFDEFMDTKGVLALKSGESFSDVYGTGRIYRGGIYRNLNGLHSFKVKVWDFTGNSSSKEVKVNLR